MSAEVRRNEQAINSTARKRTNEMSSSMTHRYRAFLLVCAILLTWSLVATVGVAEDLRGSVTVVGRGPERPAIEALAQAFEKTHIGTAVDIKWNRAFRTVEMVMAGEAGIAVGGKDEADMTATTVAWDGLAVVVNFSNPIKELTTRDVASLFSGVIRDWSELDEKAEGKVRLIVRPTDQNLTDGFERALGIVGQVPVKTERIRSDQKVLSRVSGQLDAVGYMSLRAALDAVNYGMSVRALVIDGVEPGAPTVRSGQYKLKRPVVLLSPRQPNPLVQAFVEFALSPAGQRILSESYVPVH